MYIIKIKHNKTCIFLQLMSLDITMHLELTQHMPHRLRSQTTAPVAYIFLPKPHVCEVRTTTLHRREKVKF